VILRVHNRPGLFDASIGRILASAAVDIKRLWVYMYTYIYIIYMYVCMYVCMYIRMYIRMYVCNTYISNNSEALDSFTGTKVQKLTQKALVGGEQRQPAC
jgi:hypothetical protein